ncbi:MAG: hypothetical protein LBG15_04255 [Dysgonamonadaceae bacterium]|jgi:hypothetical protein|nr:hypothetical protein [Dysgonamonadaceae bacterium]
MYELSKSQKKIARRLIDKGLQIECGECLKKVELLLSNNKSDNLSAHETYLELYQLIEKFDKHIAQRYDRLGGSRYFITVLRLFMEDVISLKDLEDFNSEIRDKLLELRKTLSE